MPEQTARARPLTLEEDRFARLDAIEWWQRERIRGARVLVIGVGALGNEVLKNLALLGIGNVVVNDMDRVELSNLTRSVLFRESDRGDAKALCAVKAVRELCPDIAVHAIVGSVLSDVGLGFFRWADVVVGALDNREARVFVNSACGLVGTPWIDGGIDVLQGVVRGFAPPETSCYECTMNSTDWELLNQRRSCSLLARRAATSDGTPTTPTTASIIAAMQVQEVVKLLHGMDTLLGRGIVFDGAHHDSYVVDYPLKPDCEWHEPQPPIEAVAHLDSDTPLTGVWQQAVDILGGCDALDFSRDLVTYLECPKCGSETAPFAPPDRIPERLLRCDGCDTECVPRMLHSLSPGDPLLERRGGDLGLPRWDIIWARYGDRMVGIELAGDSPFPTAPLSDSREGP